MNEAGSFGTGIGSAVAALKAGYRVRRAGWNGKGKGMWLSLTVGRRVGAAAFWSPHNSDFARTQYDMHAEVLPYVTMKTADDKIVPWLCSQTDLLADDWEVMQ
jgi:hypothetical protein